MIDDGVGRVGQAIAVGPPPVAQLPIFAPSADTQVPGVESANLSEWAAGSARLFVAKKREFGRVGVVVRVEVVDQELGGARVRIAGQAVEGPAPDQLFRLGVEMCRQSLEPTRGNRAVVVDEGEELSSRSCRASVARLPEPSSCPAHELQIQDGRGTAPPPSREDVGLPSSTTITSKRSRG